MFLCSLIEELCAKEENFKTGCNFNFGHECILRKAPTPIIINFCFRVPGWQNRPTSMLNNYRCVKPMQKNITDHKKGLVL